MRKIRAVILDFDGVLAESNAEKDAAFEALFARYPEHASAMREYHRANHAAPRMQKFQHYVDEVFGTRGKGASAEDLARQFFARLGSTEGIVVEDKGLSLSIHYRLVRKSDEKVVAEVFHQITSPYLRDGKIRVTFGKKVWEVRPPIDWHKGKAVETITREIMALLSLEKALTIYLGDNTTDADISEQAKSFKEGALLFLKKVADPERFGVPVFSKPRKGKKPKIQRIDEKPKNPASDYAVTGLYIYDNQVFDIIRGLKPSERGQFEITDVNNEYLKKGKLDWIKFDAFWTDAGTPASLLKANVFWAVKKGVNLL